ncbi:hypothetical protein HDU96_004169 [Phlyctochytrium bullatum]|nr:hypothetical protein HDU96_004169 [Phlyctochytrium bullatum]
MLAVDDTAAAEENLADFASRASSLPAVVNLPDPLEENPAVIKMLEDLLQQSYDPIPNSVSNDHDLDATMDEFRPLFGNVTVGER